MEVEVVKTYGTNIGDYYDYSVTLNEGTANKVTIDDWKVLWKDSGGIYIITSDYLPNVALGTGTDSIKEKIGLTTSGKYVTFWNTVPTSDLNNLTNSFEVNLLSNYHKKYNLKASSEENAKCVSKLLNTENWSQFVDSSQRAKYAIGGPTLEMWIMSWNEKTKGDDNKAVISCQGSGTGYQMKIDSKTGIVTNDNDVNYDYILNNMNKTDEYKVVAKSENLVSLYYPYTGNKDICFGYWLASPSCLWEKSVCLAYYDAVVGSHEYYLTYLGLRPVVYIQ